MGVLNLWKALERGGAVEELVGSQAGQHAQIVEALENKVVAVDLSAWLMQAQSQPALLEHLDSPYARAVKVVFDRVRCQKSRTFKAFCQQGVREPSVPWQQLAVQS